MEWKGQAESNWLLLGKYQGNVFVQIQINFDQTGDNIDNNQTQHNVNNKDQNLYFKKAQTHVQLNDGQERKKKDSRL